MSTFAYKALDSSGSTVQGEIEADDKVAVASQLRSRGLIVVDIDEQAAGGGDIFERFKKVKPDELTVATRQFSTMVSSGMSMLRALRARGAAGEPQAQGRIRECPQGRR